jgi:hypothetical protein
VVVETDPVADDTGRVLDVVEAPALSKVEMPFQRHSTRLGSDDP